MFDRWHQHFIIRNAAHILERTGLALTGGLCALFVAVNVGPVHIDLVGSMGLLLAVVIYGAAGFYFGIDIPPSGRAADSSRSSHRFVATRFRIEILSSIGTFLAAAAAAVAASITILDQGVGPGAIVLLSLIWLSGATMQIATGVTARLQHFKRNAEHRRHALHVAPLDDE